MSPRKRPVSYPPARTATRQPRPGQGDPSTARPSVVSIDLDALAGRDGLTVGDRVRIGGTGGHAGEVGVIERILRSAIPSAVIRTASGQARARTIDLTPVADGSPAAEGSTVAEGSTEPAPQEEGTPA